MGRRGRLCGRLRVGAGCKARLCAAQGCTRAPARRPGLPVHRPDGLRVRARPAASPSLTRATRVAGRAKAVLAAIVAAIVMMLGLNSGKWDTGRAREPRMCEGPAS